MTKKAPKSPAFQFYPKDWLSDENVVCMTMEERGIYISLMAHCWLEGTIPADPKRVKKLLKLDEKVSLSTLKIVLDCFEETPTNKNRLFQKRLLTEHEKQKKWRKKCSAGGRKSKRGKALQTEN